MSTFSPIQILLFGSAGISVGIVTWLLVNLYSSFDFSRKTVDERDYEGAPLFLRIFLPFGRGIGSVMMDMAGREKDSVKKYSRRIARLILMAGEPAGMDSGDFTGISAVCGMVGTGLGVLIYVMVGAYGGALIAGGFLLGALLPYIWLTDLIKSRQKQIRRGLPYCLDLVTLAVEAGMDFTTALQIVAEKLSVPALAMELKRTLRAIQMGRMRSDALRDLSRRVNVPELSSVTAAIIQADQLGASLAPILRIQAEQLRIRRFQLAEKLAMEAPVKILLPLIAFLFPTTIIVIFGPIAAGYLSRNL